MYGVGDGGSPTELEGRDDRLPGECPEEEDVEADVEPEAGADMEEEPGADMEEEPGTKEPAEEDEDVEAKGEPTESSGENKNCRPRLDASRATSKCSTSAASVWA